MMMMRRNQTIQMQSWWNETQCHCLQFFAIPRSSFLVLRFSFFVSRSCCAMRFSLTKWENLIARIASEVRKMILLLPLSQTVILILLLRLLATTITNKQHVETSAWFMTVTFFTRTCACWKMGPAFPIWQWQLFLLLLANNYNSMIRGSVEHTHNGGQTNFWFLTVWSPHLTLARIQPAIW